MSQRAPIVSTPPCSYSNSRRAEAQCQARVCHMSDSNQGCYRTTASSPSPTTTTSPSSSVSSLHTPPDSPPISPRLLRSLSHSQYQSKPALLNRRLSAPLPTMTAAPHPYPQRPPSRCENLLRETLLKDELQRERDMYDDKPHHRGREQPKSTHQRRRASLHRSITEGTTLPRAASLSPTRRLNQQQHRLRHPRSHSHLHQSYSHSHHHSHSRVENPYDQVLRARLERVLTTACASNGGGTGSDPSCSCCHVPIPGHAETDSRREKRVSFPATPLGGGGGFFGWFWRDGEERHIDMERKSSGSECSTTSSLSQSEAAYHLPTVMTSHHGDAGTSSHLHPSSSMSYSYNRTRSYTAPSSARHSPTLPRSELTSRLEASSTMSSPPRKTWVVPIPLETVYSGEAADDTAEPGLVQQMATDKASVPSASDEGMLTPPPTPPGEGREAALPPSSSSSASSHHQHRRTHSAQVSRSLTLPKGQRPRASSAAGDSTTSYRSLPLAPPPASHLQPHPHSAPPYGLGVEENPRKFNVRTASAQLRQVEGLVSFMAVEGLGEPEPGPEETLDGDDVTKGKKGNGRRWLLF